MEVLLGPRNEATACGIPDALLPGGKDAVEVSNDNGHKQMAVGIRQIQRRRPFLAARRRRLRRKSSASYPSFPQVVGPFYRDLAGQTLPFKLLSAVFWTIPQPLDAVNCGEKVSSSSPSED